MNPLVGGKEGFVKFPSNLLETIDPKMIQEVSEKCSKINKINPVDNIVGYHILTSGKYDASPCSSDNVSINGNIKSGFKISPNPKPKAEVKNAKNQSYGSREQAINCLKTSNSIANERSLL